MREDPRIGRLAAGEAEELSGAINPMPSIAMGELDSNQGVVLKDWSAQDFANIYVRFRPHLISHARKFLREESQAEEVVQDAFLYLMTALPELDSELGVLRFLKWKTKMLSLDVLRTSNSGINRRMVPLSDDIPEEPQAIDMIERAEDAAVIRLALAKLSSRQREALIATIYEEKTYDQAAHQMGLSENAFRQLLHRARASFKQALVGEAAIEGRSIPEILLVATRRAGKKSAVLGIPLFIVLASLSSGLLGPIQQIPQANVQVGLGIDNPSGNEQESSGPLMEPLNEDGFDAQPPASFTTGEFVSEVSGALNDVAEAQQELPRTSAEATTLTKDQQRAQGEIQETEKHRELRNLLGPSLVERISSANYQVSEAAKSNSLISLSLTGDQSVTGNFGLQFDESKEIRPQYAWLTVISNGHEVGLVPRSVLSLGKVQKGVLECTQILYTDFIAGDTGGTVGDKAVADTAVGHNGALLEICVGDDGGFSDSTLIFSNKT